MKKNSLFIVFVFLPIIVQAQILDNRLTMNGTDPTEPRTRIDINIAEAEFISSGDLFSTRFNADIAFVPWLSIGVGIPYYYAAFPSATASGIGDITLGFLLNVLDKKHKEVFQAISFGTDFSLKSGDPEAGTGLGQYIATPYLTASFYLADYFMIAPIIQEYYSFGAEPDAQKLNQTSFRIRNVIASEDGHWLALTPDLIIDYEGIYRPTLTLHSSLGYMVDKNWAISGDFVFHVYGDQRFSSLGRLNVRYLFDMNI